MYRNLLVYACKMLFSTPIYIYYVTTEWVLSQRTDFVGLCLDIRTFSVMEQKNFFAIYPLAITTPIRHLLVKIQDELRHFLKCFANPFE